jgi:hypothetical protein
MKQPSGGYVGRYDDADGRREGGDGDLYKYNIEHLDGGGGLGL